MTIYATGMTITNMVTRNMTISDLPSVSIEYGQISSFRHHDGNWIFDHISGQTPSQQKIALIDRFVQKNNRYLYRRTSWLPIRSVYLAENGKL